MVEGEIDNQLWILKCGDTEGILVTFTNSGDNKVTVTTQYVVLPEDEDDLEDFVKQFADNKDIKMIGWDD